MKGRIVLLVLMCSFFLFTKAQNITVKTSTDKTNILIGEQLTWKFELIIPNGFVKKRIILPDSLPHFELVETKPVDSVFENNTTKLTQSFIITSFDSGAFALPSIKIARIANTVDTTYAPLFSDSITINVSYAVADSTNQLRDIKPIIEEDETNYFWYYICAAIIILGLLIFVIIKYLNKKKKEKPDAFTSSISAYNEAIKELQKLKEKNIESPNDLKEFYTKLTHIFKWYISRKQKQSILNKTTGDVLVLLVANDLPKDVITETAVALRCSDAVKFAKYIPSANENENNFNIIKNTIQFIHQKSAAQKQ